MKIYLISLAAGLLVGIIYSLLNVRSPAPPMVALVGLLGILIGEQLIPFAKTIIKGDSVTTSWLHHQVKPHVFGDLPKATTPPARQDATSEKATG
ncbi:XapX domain-containing protein [Rhizobium oryzicola]|uniref:XapX domain-containing protein n=1 Tax=Rhizobium oryzicola TaxID=1232668 RepID=A0ABT8T5H4_9HYPH|nr:XapX domain-containing protein [Rhizobium oryzicola]MDO1585308.1 XapX domain-containing protein [Rhizobium oryzicola]